MPCKLLQIADSHQIRTASQGRAEAAEACAPDNRQKNRRRHGIIRNLALPQKAEHAHSHRQQNHYHYDVRQKNRQQRGSHQPDANLLAHRRPQTAQAFYRQTLVEMRLFPHETD